MPDLGRGARRFITSERKSFDVVLEGRTEDRLRITENGRQRRSTVVLLKKEMVWLKTTWEEFWKEDGGAGWCRRFRENGRTALLQLSENNRGRMVTIAIIGEGNYRSVICPEGVDQKGWKEWSKAMTDLIDLADEKTGRNVRRVSYKEAAMKGTNHEVTRGQVIVELCCDGCGKQLRGVFRESTVSSGQTQMIPASLDEVTGEQDPGEEEERPISTDRSLGGKGAVQKKKVLKGSIGPDIGPHKIKKAHSQKDLSYNNEMVRKWVQKYNPNRQREDRGKTQGVEFHKRRSSSDKNKQRSEGSGIIIREESTKRRSPNLEGKSSTSGSDELRAFSYFGEEGQTSREGERNDMALIPIESVSVEDSDTPSQFPIDSQYSQWTDEFWSSVNEAVEERARRWIMENIINMGRSLGVSFEGKEHETVHRIAEIEDRRMSSDTMKRTERRNRSGKRELRGLKCEVNYERSKGKSAKPTIGYTRRRKGVVHDDY